LNDLSVKERLLKSLDFILELIHDFFDFLERAKLISDLGELELTGEPVFHEAHLLVEGEELAIGRAVLLNDLLNDVLVDWANSDKLDELGQALLVKVMEIVDERANDIAGDEFNVVPPLEVEWIFLQESHDVWPTVSRKCNHEVSDFRRSAVLSKPRHLVGHDRFSDLTIKRPDVRNIVGEDASEYVVSMHELFKEPCQVCHSDVVVSTVRVNIKDACSDTLCIFAEKFLLKELL